MKLRIKGNSLRLRLSRSEVDELGTSGRVVERAMFGPAAENWLTYSVERYGGSAVTGSFVDGKITIMIPEKIVDDWVSGEQVGIEGEQSVGEQMKFTFLVEKDFACLTPRANEDESDNFPHPKGEKSC